MAEAVVGGGTFDTLGIIHVDACVSTSDATFTGGTGSTALNAKYGCQNGETVLGLGIATSEQTLALRSRHFLHA